MNISSFGGRPFHSQILRIAALSLILFSWNIPAFCGEIHDAAKAGDLAKVKALLKGTPELISSKDDKGRTPLHLAVEEDQEHVAKWLLAHGADINAKDNNGTYTDEKRNHH
jgi:ankyrin repeat protein